MENIFRIWHFPKMNLRQKIITWHQSAEPDLGYGSSCKRE
jgi:hypothetical protein